MNLSLKTSQNLTFFRNLPEALIKEQFPTGHHMVCTKWENKPPKLKIRLRAQDFYYITVDEGTARVNYHA